VEHNSVGGNIKGGGGRGLESICNVKMAGRIMGSLPVEMEKVILRSSDNP
jgi:hypothetical protein